MPVQAQQWSFEDQGGMRTARYQDAVFSLDVGCATTAGNRANFISMQFPKSQFAGQLEFYDGKMEFYLGSQEILQLYFEAGKMTADTEVELDVFSKFVSHLKSEGELTIVLPSLGPIHFFVAGGANAAIGQCDTSTDSPAWTFASANADSKADPQFEIIDHLGFDMDSALIVTNVKPGGTADIAGLRVGDVWGERIGAGIRRKSLGRETLLTEASTQLQKYANSERVMPVHFLRNGQLEVLWFPPVPLGEEFSSVQLSSDDRALFDKLPHDLSRFFSYVYLQDYKAAKVFQMAIFDKHFEGTASALVLKATGGAEQFRNEYEQSSGRGLFSQYILIKSNAFGTCGETEVPIRVEQKRYEVWVDQFGIERSARREIEPNVYEFIVPARWAGHLLQNSPMGEASPWAQPIKDFIEAVGVCDSPILEQLEDNMLAYLSR